MLWISFFCVFVKYSKQRIRQIIDKQECARMMSAFISSEFELKGLDAAFTLQAKYSSFPFAEFFFLPLSWVTAAKGVGEEKRH